MKRHLTASDPVFDLVRSTRVQRESTRFPRTLGSNFPKFEKPNARMSRDGALHAENADALLDAMMRGNAHCYANGISHETVRVNVVDVVQLTAIPKVYNMANEHANVRPTSDWRKSSGVSELAMAHEPVAETEKRRFAIAHESEMTVNAMLFARRVQAWRKGLGR